MYPARLRHDRDQLLLLAERKLLPTSLVQRYVQGYNQILEQIPESHADKMINLPEESWARTIGMVFNRALYVPELPPLKGPALNPELDFSAIEEECLSTDPKFVYFDNLLTQDALRGLHTYYEEATVFWDDKPGYVGTHLFDGGFGNTIISQLTEELMDAFPRIICSHRLTQGWAFKYDSEIAQPVNPHADMAAINVNFWVSPDEGSLDRSSGGLVAYKVLPPPDTPFKVFNNKSLHPEADAMLAATG